MNILYIIGNGFDLNLDLETSYEDFLDYYKDQVSNDELIFNLKNNIKGKKKDWSDLELSFGKYLEFISNTEQFEIVFDDLRRNLSRFLENEQNKLNYTAIDSNILIDDLTDPFKFLLPADKVRLMKKLSNLNPSLSNIDIWTFNYTNILDNILGKNVGTIGKNRKKFIIKSIEHLHGFFDRYMIFGVNDPDQINNNKLKKDRFIISSIVKNECNKAYRQNLEVKFQSKIKNSNLIVIFGSSIGETDKIWWKKITEKLNSGSILLLFWKGVKIPALEEYKQIKYEEEIKENFLSKSGVENEDLKQKIKENIFVALNTKMFKLFTAPPTSA